MNVPLDQLARYEIARRIDDARRRRLAFDARRRRGLRRTRHNA